MLDEYDRYFTHDARDNNSNLNAVGMYSTLPLPYFDADDDNGDLKWEEAEVTSEQQLFPNANATYYSRLHLMRWWRSCPTCAYHWDGGGGSITQVAQLSMRSCPVLCDRYDSDPAWANYTFGTLQYQPKSQPSAFSGEEAGLLDGLSRREAAESMPIVGEPVPGTASLFDVGATDDPGELRVRPSLSTGLRDYRDSAIRLSRDLLRTGSGHAVVTFNRPIGRAELEDLAAGGLEIVSVEAVTQVYDGLRGTNVSLYGDHIWSEMDAIAGEFSTSFLGITAAQAVVRDRAVFDTVQGSPAVYLVDMAVEQVRRKHDNNDVVMNDLYWYLAGWASLPTH
jgi:hypothetical protein